MSNIRQPDYFIKLNGLPNILSKKPTKTLENTPTGCTSYCPLPRVSLLEKRRCKDDDSLRLDATNTYTTKKLGVLSPNNTCYDKNMKNWINQRRKENSM